jgi:hypothetical protein
MKKISLILLVFGATNLIAQQPQDLTLVKEIPTIKNNVFQQRGEIDDLTKKLNNLQFITNRQSNEISILVNRVNAQKSIIDSLSEVTTINSENIITNSKELGTKIQETTIATNSKISALDANVGKNRLFWIIGTLGTLLLGGLLYLLLGKRIQSNKSDVETQIKNTKASLDEESVKLDSKLVEVLNKQLEVLSEERKTVGTSEEADHSLVLKVADRLISMEKNLSRMDAKTKGLKQLKKGVESIKDNFAVKGYEIVEMLGKEYNEGMKVSVGFIQDEDFEEGKRIITRIIKPQVNYNGVMIQTAQIEVTEA